MKRGALIVLEGCDRVGKTTQGKLLVQALKERNLPAQFLPFPDRSTCIGKVLDGYLSNKEDVSDRAIHLLFSGNRWELESKMKQLLNSGTTLIVDRYAFSGVAYSAAKEGMQLEWCRQSEVGLPRPDCVLLFKLSHDSNRKRPGFGEERYENERFLKKVWDNFMQLKDHTFQEVNADKTVEELNRELLEVVLKTVDQSQNAPISKLWTSD